VSRFAELLQAREVLLSDGATGTNYQDRGIEPGVAPEEWLLDRPEEVVDLHRRFADAGSDIVLTCTFGASAVRLQDSALAGQARELNLLGAELARRAVGEGGVLVAGSIGPSGQLVEPLGPLGRDECSSAVAEQARALADGGADLLVLETFFALDEALWAAEAALSVTDLPVVVSFSFDQGTRTMMGLSPTDVVAAVDKLPLAAVGANCGRSLDDTAAVVREFAQSGMSAPLWIKPNAGVPQIVGDAVVYPEGPESFAAQLAEFAPAGARILGGCCGSTPEHLEALRRALGGVPR
jgi:5-methyltetrahydrofolate--homocysteine methyltransferase